MSFKDNFFFVYLHFLDNIMGKPLPPEILKLVSPLIICMYNIIYATVNVNNV